MSLIKVRGLSIGYNSEPISEHIDFEVNRGDFLCIVGENGSGKSTLVRTLIRLQPKLGGEIIMEGLPERGAIGYLPQQTEVQKDFPASVGEVVLSGCQGRTGIRPFYNRQEKQLAWENMERMDILSLRKKCYRELSGGQQQRALLARALCAADKLLLLDEPVTGLDPKATKEMYELISSLNDEGVTIIMISHDMEAAARYATHILHMGSRPLYATRTDYLESEQGKAFLGEVVS